MAQPSTAFGCGHLATEDLNQSPLTLTGDSHGLLWNLDQILNAPMVLKNGKYKRIDIDGRHHTKVYLPLIMFAMGSHFCIKGS